jgi:hypothetical protein
VFVLRSIINHELYADQVKVDGEGMYGIAGWAREEDANEFLNTTIKEKFGKYHADDWKVLDLDDHKYYEINEHLNNDSDYKAFCYDSGAYEILNTITGRLIRY